MAVIKIVINGQVADLPESGLNLPLTYSLKSRDGFAINSGSRSEYSFELPATKNNDSIFGIFYDTGNLNIDKQKFVSASIEVDGQDFFKGKAQLQSVTLSKSPYRFGGKVYKIAFYGNNLDWALQISNILLKELPYTDHIYGRGQNFTAWLNVYPTYEHKYILLKLKDWTTVGQVDCLEDSHPAIFVAYLVNAIFNSIGYTVESTFFSTEFAKKLILPVPILNKYLQGQYGLDYLNCSFENSAVYLPYFPSGTGGGSYLDNQTYAPAVGANPYDTSTTRYTFPTDGYYLVKSYTKIYDIVGSAQFVGYVIQGGAPVVDWFWGDLVPFVTEREFRFERVVFATAGQYIDFGYIGGGDSVSSPTAYYKVDWKNEVIGEAELTNGFTLNMKYILPDWNALDFLKGLAHAFNLVFETNEGERKVTIEPSDRYLIESRNINTRALQDGFYNGDADYTDYVDLSSGGELVSDTRQLSNIKLRWKDDSNDPTVEALNDGQDLGILEARFSFPENRYKKGETVIENPFFAPTIVLADEEIVYRDGSNHLTKIPMVPIIWKENYLETPSSTEIVDSIEPRLLVSEIPLEQYNGSIYALTGKTVVVTPCPVAYMVDYNDTEGYQTSLSFANVTVNGFFVSGLLQRFYLAEMVRLMSGKYLECFMFWDAVKLQKLTFRDRITLFGDKYILQEINSYDVAKSKPTKTYLKYYFQEPEAEDKIDNTIIEAKVNII